jgi:hypothetical protein
MNEGEVLFYGDTSRLSELEGRRLGKKACRCCSGREIGIEVPTQCTRWKPVILRDVAGR